VFSGEDSPTAHLLLSVMGALASAGGHRAGPPAGCLPGTQARADPGAGRRADPASRGPRSEDGPGQGVRGQPGDRLPVPARRGLDRSAPPSSRLDENLPLPGCTRWSGAPSRGGRAGGAGPGSPLRCPRVGQRMEVASGQGGHRPAPAGCLVAVPVVRLAEGKVGAGRVIQPSGIASSAVKYSSGCRWASEARR
jgi:hypothetical protein